MRNLVAQPVADDLHSKIKERVHHYLQKYGRSPKLVVVLVGDQPASIIYTRRKGKVAVSLGMQNETIKFAATVSPDTESHVVTLAEPEGDSDREMFVIMPFRERETGTPAGFFDEVLKSLITPAGRKAGFKVTTANRQGSDVIQSTIINSLLNADLVLADLTEHNPNVLFELGMRMAHDKPVALIRASGTGPIFDVDNMLRVYDYSPSLWATTVERDLPKMVSHIEATWENRGSERTYMKLLHRPPAPMSTGNGAAAPATR